MAFFSFEAGTRCLTGEGLYAFATPRAQEIFNIVAERCAPPVQKLNYEDIKLSLNPMQTMCPTYPIKRQLASGSGRSQKEVSESIYIYQIGMLSLKKEAFINQPMELKETTSVGGIGKIFGEKLKMQGFHYA